MNNYFNKLLVYMVIGVLLVAALWFVNNGSLVNAMQGAEDKVTVLETPLNPLEETALLNGRQQILILYSKGDTYSEKLTKNLQKVCKWLKTDCNLLDTSRKDTVSYADYDMVIIATQSVETEIGVDLGRMINYANQGGKLLWAILPDDLGLHFQSIYRNIGIMDYGAFTSFSGFHFTEELIPGCAGLSFEGDEFQDACAIFLLEDSCRIYMKDTEHGTPLMWTKTCGDGKIAFFNMTSTVVDYFTGMLSAGIMTLYDTFLYPVINAKTVFIDDFPSMQYNSDSDVIKADYNRTIKEFYRDIWWPDMQSAAKQYGIAYTGLFMATYDDVVNPENFSYSKDSMEQYYGNSLLKNHFELGAHGYNHQPLTLEGGTPDFMGYRAWNSTEDMKQSLYKFIEISESLFQTVKMETYVPPSNYLSKEGREAVVAALPDLKAISGVYTQENEDENVYAQDFEISEDGIAEYPRISAGMLKDVYGDFSFLCAAGLYGAFSHFVHPDDILDEERGGGLEWQKLFQNYCDKLEILNTHFSSLRPLTATEAADALWIAYYAEPEFTITEDKIEGIIYNYYGEVQFYLKSEKKPEAASDGVNITPLRARGDGNYYLVQVSKPSFSIYLK